MLSFLRRILPFGPKEAPEEDKATLKSFRRRYAHFKKLLDANAALAELMADVEAKLHGNVLFGYMYLQHVEKRVLYLVKRMVANLQGMSPGKYLGLNDPLERIAKELAAIMREHRRQERCPELVLTLDQINLSHVDWVGGKSANLGEMRNKAHIPIPRGFVITTGGYRAFMEHNGLEADIMQKLASIVPDDRDRMAATLEAIRSDIIAAEVPDALQTAIDAAWQSIFANEPVTLAVRSSAQAEDGAKSFAGQFSTKLHVPKNELLTSYKHVVASLFTPTATLYRMHQGIPITATAMAVACLEMVHAVASGVAYSHDPVNLLNDTIIINGVWGLGKYAVDGIVPPDMWVLTRDDVPPSLIRRRAGTKDKMLTINEKGVLMERQIPKGQQRALTLSDEEVIKLAQYVMALEKNYGKYQDVEWAKDNAGNLIFLQSRPLDTRSGSSAPKPPLFTDHTLLLQSEDIACQGVGHGPVIKPQTPEDLAHFPEGGVLVALHSSAQYAQVMDKAQAVITESGGITGHMATICREFHVPCILNVPKAMSTLQQGMTVTVDAFNGYVYDGVVEELLPLRLNLESVRLEDTEILVLLRRLANVILPLYLTDPDDAHFSPIHCRTVHDIMRFVHEYSYHEMFAISDTASNADGVSLKLDAPLPIDLHIIDLDKGTTEKNTSGSVKPEGIACAPLQALLKGMLRPDTMFRKPRPVNMSGFLSVMGQQIATPQGGERFGDKSYAIISDRYMNFSSRVGYHYSVLDAYCGNTESKNYISFSFQGGAAGEIRRIRRCKAIALVLEALGFTVTRQGDMVKSRFQKYPRHMIEDRMDQIGRLLQVTRQMDMLMVDDASVSQFRDNFMKGIYQ